MSTRADNVGKSTFEEELSLKQLFQIVWSGKWIIFATTIVFAVIAASYSLKVSDEYKATVVLAPSEGQGSNKLSALADQFGGLASLAGINLNNPEANEAVVAMEIMTSWHFAEEFINKNSMSAPLYASTGWNKGDNSLIFDSAIYDCEDKKWLTKNAKGEAVPPSSWKLYKEFKKRVSVNQNSDTGLINVSVTFYSPELAAIWANALVSEINSYMKEKALLDANKSIGYLEKQIQNTSIAELRNVFSQLIQEQHKTLMLAEISDEYIFRTISRAKIPEEKVKPSRVIMTLLGGIIGLLLGLIVTFIRFAVRRN